MKQRRDVFFAIADEHRRAILERLVKEDRSLPIAEIATGFDVSRNAVAKHIQVLKESGLVTTTFVGRENHISLHAQQLAEVHQWVAIFEDFWKARLGRLKKLVEQRRKR